MTIVRSFIDYIRASIAELGKVEWPSRREVLQYTGIIVAAVAVSMIIVAIIDYGLTLLVQTYVIK